MHLLYIFQPETVRLAEYFVHYLYRYGNHSEKLDWIKMYEIYSDEQKLQSIIDQTPEVFITRMLAKYVSIPNLVSLTVPHS